MSFKIIATIAIKLTIFGFMGQTALAQVNNPPLAKQPTIKVKEINIEGNTVFSDSELEELASPLEEQELTPEQILDLVNLLTNYYVSRGYRNSGAFIPPQKMLDGDITIKIIEGTLVGIEIRGLSRLDEKYIKSRLPSIEKPLNINQLLNSLARLKKNSLIKDLSAEVKVQDIGKNILLVEVKEANPIATTLTLTNGYSPSVGEFGGNISFTHNNLLGKGDRFNINSSLTDGLNRIGASYSILVNKLDGRITFEYNTANVENIEEEVEELGIEADYDFFAVEFKQPIIVTPAENFTLGTRIEIVESETFVLDGELSFPFVEGLPDGESKITTLQFFQEYARGGSSSYFAIFSQFNVGIDVFDATRTEAGIDGIAWFWQGDVQHFKSLDKNRNVLLVSRLAAQLTPDKLLPLQQATIGGISTVKGYRSNLTLGDNILFGTTELRFILVKDEKLGSISIIPFVDFGTVWNNDRETPGSNTFVSTGLGLRYRLREIVEFRINYAVPLVEATGFGATDTEERFSFYFLFRPIRF